MIVYYTKETQFGGEIIIPDIFIPLANNVESSGVLVFEFLRCVEL